jgi:hypothetical protein
MLLEPLFAHAASQPDELAVIDDSGRYTYQSDAPSSPSHHTAAAIYCYD